MKKKLIIPSALSLLALVGVTAGCGSKENLDAMVRIYGGDRLDYVVKQDGKETKNIQFGKDLEITFTPKVDMTVGEGESVKQLSFSSLDGIEGHFDPDPETKEPIYELSTSPFVGYGNKVYHPFEYRLTKDVSYFWDRKDNGTNKPASYVLKVPAANFKKNIIVAFDESIWLPDIVLDSQNQFKKLGVTYPYFDTPYMKQALEVVLGEGYVIPSTIETYHGVNEYTAEDVLGSEDPYINQYLLEREGDPDESKVFLDRTDDKEGKFTIDNYDLCGDGITYSFELSGNYFFGTLNNLNVTNFVFELEKEDGTKVTFGGSVDNKNTFTVSTLNNYAFVTFDWASLYDIDTKAITMTPKYTSIKCTKADSNVLCDVICTNEGRTSKKWGGRLNYLATSTHKFEGAFVYKDKMNMPSMAPIVNYYTATTEIDNSGNYVFPDIVMTFAGDNETKVYNFGSIETKKVDFVSSILKSVYFRTYYRELPDTGWCISIVEAYPSAERKKEEKLDIEEFTGMYFGSKSTTSFLYPGKTSYAKSITITLPDA